MVKLQKYGWIVAVSVVLGGFLSACKDVSNPIGSDKKVQNDEEIRAYIAKNNIAAQSTKEGLYYKVVTKGSSAQKPEVGDEVRVRFVARRLDGFIVDSSEVNRSSSNSFLYKAGGLLYYTGQPLLSAEALELIFGSLLSEGDSALLLVPSQLGSGAGGSLLLPAYSPVRIDLKVVSISTEKERIDAFIKDRSIFISETTESGLRFGKTLSQPDSALLKAGDKVLVKFTGRLLDNAIFDSGTRTETVGSNGSEKGFTEGIAKLRVGEKANLVFPSSLGYGPKGNQRNQVLGYAPLYFEVEVLSRTK